ncbi:hypothetical protein F5B21DRAFT_516677 [Xylaria acuta]|nr:hypothetical protein F5B21DRAFT_516677 [Xylaria acuta]
MDVSLIHRTGPLFCIFCGLRYDREKSGTWRYQCSGLWNGPGGLVLTGVGLDDDSGRGLFHPPADSNARWEDEGYNRPMELDFDVVTQCRWEDRYGFAFHEVCWRLLEKALSNRAVSAPLERLFQVLSSSLPLHGGTVAENDYFFPWENGFECHERVASTAETCEANPCDAAEADQILAETPQSPPEIVVTTPIVGTMGKDPFNTLSPELSLAITKHLLTSDVLNARLASRAFSPTFYDQQFWASRFRGASDRSWFFEAWDRQQATDWRWLYLQTDATRIGPVLRNRRRIWKRLDAVIDTLALRWRHRIDIPISHPLNLNSSQLVEVAGMREIPMRREMYREDTRISLDNGCYLLYKHSVTIPENLSRLSIAYIHILGVGYISGIKFTTTTGNVVQLAVGTRGVQALKCLTGSDTTSGWLGCPDNSPKTRRLAVFDSLLDLLEVGFDGFKMVHLATTTIPPRVPEKDTLRSSGLWYPDIPGSALSLNESSFFLRSNFVRGYKPLFWTNFGGPGGKYLSHLIQISVGWWNGIHHIDFRYDIDVPAEYGSLGRCPPRITSRFYFDIDGPGGEIINAIELGYSRHRPPVPTADFHQPRKIMLNIRRRVQQGRRLQQERRHRHKSGRSKPWDYYYRVLR